MNPGRVSNRKNSDPESLERDNDRELEELASKATYLRQLTIGMRDDVESQNLILNNIDDRTVAARTGLSGVVSKFKSVMETPNGKKNTIFVAGITIAVLFLLFMVTR